MLRKHTPDCTRPLKPVHLPEIRSWTWWRRCAPDKFIVCRHLSPLPTIFGWDFRVIIVIILIVQYLRHHLRSFQTVSVCLPSSSSCFPLVSIARNSWHSWHFVFKKQSVLVFHPNLSESRFCRSLPQTTSSSCRPMRSGAGQWLSSSLRISLSFQNLSILFYAGWNHEPVSIWSLKREYQNRRA